MAVFQGDHQGAGGKVAEVFAGELFQTRHKGVGVALGVGLGVGLIFGAAGDGVGEYTVASSLRNLLMSTAS